MNSIGSRLISLNCCGGGGKISHANRIFFRRQKVIPVTEKHKQLVANTVTNSFGFKPNSSLAHTAG